MFYLLNQKAFPHENISSILVNCVIIYQAQELAASLRGCLANYRIKQH